MFSSLNVALCPFPVDPTTSLPPLTCNVNHWFFHYRLFLLVLELSTDGHTTYIILCLTSFAQHNVLRFIHAVAFINNLFLSVLSSIPLYRHTTTCWYIYQLMHTKVVSSVNTIVKKASVNVHAQVLVWTLFHLSWVNNLGQGC